MNTNKNIAIIAKKLALHDWQVENTIRLMDGGATIPFIKAFEEGLNAPVLAVGVEDPYTLAHSENESLLLSDFYKGIESEIELFAELAKSYQRR